jgi:hypothetical protein
MNGTERNMNKPERTKVESNGEEKVGIRRGGEGRDKQSNSKATIQ